MNSRDCIPPGYVSVTEILKPYTKLDKIDPVVLANAADRGTRVHKWCTLYALNLLFIDVDPDCKGYVEAFKRWYDQYVDSMIREPTRLYCHQDRLTGEFDLYVKFKGSDASVLIDIKTPATVSPTWQIQTAGYKYLIEQDISACVDRRLILQLPKDGSNAIIHEHKNHKSDVQIFENALSVYRYFNP
jgi:hypothetical protein